jgi:hypothetical protein
MSNRTAWFIGGLLMLSLLAIYAPRVAGVVVILVVSVLAIELANKKLL